MTDKELKHLSRAALIDIIYELQKQNQQKDADCQELQDALEKRELILSEAGSIAEAALQINNVMETAQAAADQYLLSLKAANGKAEQSIVDAQHEHDRIILEAQVKAKKIEEEARQNVASLWNDFQDRVSKTIHSEKEFSLSTEARM